MRSIFLIFMLLLSYTLLYSGFSQFGTTWFALPA